MAVSAAVVVVSGNRGARAVFLDRDGVLIEDRGGLVASAAISVLPGVAGALVRLSRAGFDLVVVTNQPIIARGLATEEGVSRVNDAVSELLLALGGAPIRRFYVCPHHPNADLAEYRLACDCRKPRPGLVLRAAAELGLDLGRSYMVGDRMSDVAAGARAGCRTILVRTGDTHLAPPIETPDPVEPDLVADHVVDDLAAAAHWILSR